MRSCSAGAGIGGLGRLLRRIQFELHRHAHVRCNGLALCVRWFQSPLARCIQHRLIEDTGRRAAHDGDVLRYAAWVDLHLQFDKALDAAIERRCRIFRRSHRGEIRILRLPHASDTRRIVVCRRGVRRCCDTRWLQGPSGGTECYREQQHTPTAPARTSGIFQWLAQRCNALCQRMRCSPVTGERCAPSTQLGLEHCRGIDAALAWMLCQHGRIAGQFLIQPERTPGQMHQRVEPTDAEHQGRKQIGMQIAAAQMQPFVRQHQRTFGSAIARSEIRRHHNTWAPDSH